VVEGEAGIGKTRLCEEVLAEELSQGVLVCSASCRPATRAIPYAALSTLLRSAIDRMGPTQKSSAWLGLQALEGVLHLKDGQPAAPLPPEVVLADAVSEFFRRLSVHQPVVVFLDSAEFLDEPSARALAVLADRSARRKMFVLLCGRDLRTAFPDVQRLRAQLLRSDGEYVRLARLDDAEVMKLITRAGRGPSGAGTARLVKAAQGLPLYLAGELAGTASSGFEVPPTVRVLVEEISAELDSEEQELLRMLALSPCRGIVPEVLTEALFDGGKQLDEIMRLSAGIPLIKLLSGPPERWVLRHPAYAEVLLESMAEAERQGVRRRLAAALRNHDRDPVVLAEQFLALRNEIDSDELAGALAAAADCHDASYVDTVQFLTELLALPVLQSDQGSRQLRYEQLAAAQQQLGDLEGADASLSRALEEEAVERTPGGELASARVQVGLTSWETGKYAPASGQLPDPSAIDLPLFHDPSYRAVMKLLWCSRHGTTDQTRRAVAEATACSRFGIKGQAAAMMGRSVEAALDGAYGHAAFHARDACAAARASHQVDLRILASLMIFRFAPLTGGVGLATEAAEEILAESEAMGLPTPQYAIHIWLSILRHLQGDLTAAEQHRQLASLSAAASASARTQAKTALLGALLQAERGEFARAGASLAVAQRSYAKGIEDDAQLYSLALYARAVVSVQLGDETPRILPDTLQLWGTYPQTIAMLPFLSGLVALRQGDVRLAASRIDELKAHQVESPALAALGFRLQGLVALQRGDVQVAGESLRVAADSLDQFGLRLYAAQTRLEWAETLPDGQLAADTVGRLLEYFGSQQVGWWLQRTRRLARRHRISETRVRREGTVLTQRQADVVRLAAEGLSNAEIASRLFLSERTVETHLHFAYSRLNIASRIGLTAWAMENLPNLSTGTDTEPGP
jgi:DNA-binding CsgD family transcriptional regulator